MISKGSIFCEIPIVGGGSGTAELGENLGLVLSKVDGAIVQGHGTFAVGGTLEEAYVATTRMEHSCKVKYYVDLMGKNDSDFCIAKIQALKK